MEKQALFYTFEICISSNDDDAEKGIGPFIIVQSDDDNYFDRFEEIIGDVTYFELEILDRGTKRPLVRGTSPYSARDNVYIHYLDGGIRRIKFSEVKYSKMLEQAKARKASEERDKKRREHDKLMKKALSKLPRYIHDPTWATYRKYFRDASGTLICFQFEKLHSINGGPPFFRMAMEQRSSINQDDLTDKFVVTKAEWDKAKKELDAYLDGQ